jgi:MoaA/NifB/PqqE/SkfB family radical SAM enzyme
MKKPILLHYYITDFCNAKCEFCDIWKKEDKTHAKFEVVERNLVAARKLGAKFVDFTGGEPLLNPDLPKFLETAKKLGFITSVTTNALLFEKHSEKLAEKIDLLHFSIDGTRDIHDKIRGVKSFDSVMNSIEIAKKHKLFPDLLFTYTNENIDYVPEIRKIAVKNKLVLILDPVFSTDGQCLLSAETNKKAKKFAKLPAVYLNSAHLILRKNGGNNVEKPICKAIDSTIVILPDDKLALPCYHRFRVKLPINGNLETLRKSKEIADFAKLQGKLKICERCHINCYMDPSYQYSLNSLFFASNLSKLKYAFWKYFIFGQKLPILT